MSTTEKHLFPDSTILQIIFPGDASVQVALLAQTATVCTFRAYHQSGVDIVRLESGSDSSLSRLYTVAALRRVASLAIPDLVPETKRIGQGVMDGGESVYFLVMADVEGAITLCKAKSVIEEEEDCGIVEQVQCALRAIHSLKRDDERVKALLAGTEFSTRDSNLGGPGLGYFKDIVSFLHRVARELSLGSEVPSISDVEDGIVVKAKLGEEDREVCLSRETLEALSAHASFCHNDLQLRHCLVRLQRGPDGGLRYTLAAIIDWGTAGFLPCTYEMVAKHRNLERVFGNPPWYTSFVGWETVNSS